MYGYINCNKAGLSPEEIQRYQSVYCGLCNTLKKSFGQIERLSLSYDMTFLILFLSSLYEPEETASEFRCGINRFRPKMEVRNKYTEYAADMTVVLTYYKCLDDWQDEKKHLMRWYADALKPWYEKANEKYPRQCQAMWEGIDALNKVEKSFCPQPDDAVNCSGKMMSELFVYEEDFWSNSLRSLGYELGRFIYLMDAAMDYKEDLKKKCYNPLVRMHKQPEDMAEILEMSIGNVTRIFEKLPLVQDIHLLRNILYAGVWQEYLRKYGGKEQEHGRRSV